MAKVYYKIMSNLASDNQKLRPVLKKRLVPLSVSWSQSENVQDSRFDLCQGRIH